MGTNGIVLDPCMSVEVSILSYSNPVHTNGGQVVADAFMRIYGVDIKKAGALNGIYFDVKRINYTTMNFEKLFPFYWFMKLFKVVFPGKDTVKIAILGKGGCGKTELWCQLQGIPNTSGPTTQEVIKSFKLGKNKNGDIVYVDTTKDYGGGDSWVPYYNSLIDHDGVFVYYLIDLTTVEASVSDIRSRLRVIYSEISKKKLKKCGVRLLGTFFDKYKGSKNQAIDEIKNKILNPKIKGIVINPPIQIISTINKADIDNIKKQIQRVI